MAIQLYCPSCKTYVPTATKKCPKCSLIFSREGRRYRVDVTFKGQRVTRFCENLTLARELEGVIRGDLVRGEYQIVDHHARKAVTLDDVWAKYLPWAKEHKKTWDDDSYHYSKHLAPRFGNKPLKDITPFEIEKLKLDLKKGLNAHGKHYAPATIKHQIVLLRRLYNVAKKWGMYDGDNPVGQVQMPKLDNQVTEFMTDEQAENLLAVLETWPCRDSAAFVKFAMLTGFRRGELFKLKWGNVDLERGFITLQKPKGGKTVTLPISDQALSVLKSLLLHGTESQGEVDQDSYVFPGKDGKQRADFKGPWQRIREAAGLPETFRFHGLRHNFASHLVSNGVDLTVVGELLTHKSTATTQRYAHLLPTAVQEAARKSGELLTGKRGGRVVAFKEG